jgi:putative nucleotidyltransferase with HDIG domain
MPVAEIRESVEIPVKALFVDDEEYILRSIRRLLADEDIEVLTATSGEEGLGILRSNDDVGLIVSDQRMPGLTGVDFLRMARELAPQALRIMLTGYADITATIDAINKGGAYRYISKPWNDDELVMTIREALDHYRLTAENRRLSDIIRRQNEELTEWNANLKSRVLEQTASLRRKLDELHRLNEKLCRNYEVSLLAFSGLLELRDRETRNHCRNVADIAAAAAENLGLSGEEREVICVAALLHDIGKIGIADSLLREDTERMDREQLREYRLHPVRGQAAVDAVEDLRAAGILIRHHHEAYDGSGFPDGLSGTDIPLGARLISLAEAIDKRISPDRAANSIDIALDSVRKELGTRFDPALFPLFEIPTREKYGKELSLSGMVEMELSPRELRRGMIVAREVRSGTGLLLLARGESLDDAKIHSLRRYYAIDPPKAGVMVWTGR